MLVKAINNTSNYFEFFLYTLKCRMHNLFRVHRVQLTYSMCFAWRNNYTQK